MLTDSSNFAVARSLNVFEVKYSTLPDVVYM